MAAPASAEPASVDHWEDHPTEVKLSALSIEDAHDGAKEQPQVGVQGQQAPSIVFGPEPPILMALLDPKERSTVLRIEDDVLRFIGDSSRTVLEFPGSFSNYQRMLAHKVAQYHGLHTSTVDYEGGVARVVAHRRSVQDKPKPKLSTIEVTQEQVAALSTMNAKGSVSDRPKLLRRPSGHDANRLGSEQGRNSNVARTAKEREEEYLKARERIMGGGAAEGMMMNGRGMGRGAPGGRGTPTVPLPGNPGFAANGRGRGRKSNFRDRALDDPDYVRGLNRYGGMPGMVYGDPAYMQPGMYGMPGYPMDPMGQMAMPGTSPKSSSSLGSAQLYGGAAQQGQGWSVPPPAPPPSAPTGGKQGAYPPPPPPPNASSGNHAGSASGSMPSTPTGSAAGQQPGMHQHMQGGVRPYGMPMPGYGMPMGGMPYPGMPGAMPPGAMYPPGAMPGYGYGMPPGAYPYPMAPGGMPGSDPAMQQQQQAAMGGYAHPMYPMGAMPMPGMPGPSGQWAMGMPRMPMAMYPAMPGMPYPGMQGGDMGQGYAMYPGGGHQHGPSHHNKSHRNSNAHHSGGSSSQHHSSAATSGNTATATAAAPAAATTAAQEAPAAEAAPAQDQ
uniref:R3H domain-containing protein n=1 Tax=Chlamydomonas leiostraca TaxID=1034604 RepID=A0A7S0RLR2_9CHLO|eukprot:CAMPEP_0202869992 /NCGR_PEP_ID=MMETSP1391-20130828/14221_1 /ASSEMBLY_ACC=CAM_ASM_000867 /TAXON_ID=1034604 /ORGANISM="Chlamydomonas leiostraca, Strain SAG 11-49" /LENGTH=608 /DNA_ID=CAMNT_0049550409 /DNA_START=22 /DNA_END=1848 /DNA_ORIENTATION=+